MMRVVLLGLRKLAVPLLALAAGLVAAWAVREHVRQRVEHLEAAARTPQVSRLVAARDLPAGTVLEASQLAVREVPAAWAPAASLDPRAIDSVLGTRLGADLASGELLLRACLGAADRASSPSLAARIKPGQRAFVVEAADLGGLAGMLREGDAIDVYVSLPARGREGTFPVLQGVRVLAAGEGPTGSAQVTLAAGPDDALRYLSARQAGTLTALLRNRDDSSTISAAPDAGLLARARPAQAPPRGAGVEILYGDRPGEPADIYATPSVVPEPEYP
ncbi:Flp pilus assembly protein CpaB [Achromobacter pulmonis]|uniref:Flp pilus assembly protein CpaB n=1 Tax=Achromobacter pulmonis TaxID=1389932 RepID=UPI0020C65CCB|nr:Flp pilus assembly protein CpaB [Achromobacter pulmonis]